MPLLFIGLFSTFAGEIKSEDLEICKYSKPTEFAKCRRKDNVKIIPNYPVDTFDRLGALWVGSISSYYNIASAGTVFKVVELRSPNQNEIEITIGDKEATFWGAYSIGYKFNSSKTFRVNSKDIISWKYFNSGSKVGGGGLFNTSGLNHLIYKLDLKYLDDYGNINNIKANRAWLATFPNRANIISNLLTNVSKINNGFERDINKTLFSKYKRNEKNATIIKSIIKIKEEADRKCFQAKESKFPELTARYKKLYGTINPLRAKLDLPPSGDIKPICNLKNSI